jgi:hypothetical protein
MFPPFTVGRRIGGRLPRIAVNHGYCFAGNAALFGAADLTYRDRGELYWHGGPAMIEGGGLGSWKPQDIGPVSVHREKRCRGYCRRRRGRGDRGRQTGTFLRAGPLADWQARSIDCGTDAD